MNFALWKENCLFIHSNSDSDKYLYFSYLTTTLFSFIFVFFLRNITICPASNSSLLVAYNEERVLSHSGGSEYAKGKL